MRLISVLLVFALLVPMLVAQSTTSDDRIYDQVRAKLANDVEVKGAGIEVTVKAGAVTLAGTVSDAKAKEKAERITKKVKGVVSVNNQLKIFGVD